MSGAKFQKKFLSFVMLVCAVLFAPTTMIFIAGMMPTIAANVMDRSRQKNLTIAVGMMNLAGVMPFLLALWLSPAPNSFDQALGILMQPKTVIVMYLIAAGGYAIEASITGMVSAIMQQKAALRLKQIDASLEELKSRWGYYVDGSVRLDDYGFPITGDDE